MVDVQLPFDKLRWETPEIVSVLLQCIVQPFPYQAGQFFRLTLRDVANDPRGPWRFFSNSSSPTEKDIFMTTTRISQSPFKQRLKSLAHGELVTVSGPFGKFVLGDESKPYVFLGGGVGVTPFRSILKDVTDRKLPHKITLLYSSKTPKDIVFKNDLDQIAKDNPNVNIVYTITRPDESAVSWQGKTGRIDGNMIHECTTDILNTMFYVCGPPSLVMALSDIVKALGIPTENLKTELFTGYQ